MGKFGILVDSFFKKKLEGVFLFVTSKCNANCRSCFYHNELNSHLDLTFDQIKTLSETAPKFKKLWLSGGEPFMREDLYEIIKMFHDNNGVRVINLPSNGLLKKKIDDVVGKLIKNCPEMEIHMNFSLDGLGKTHDLNRAVKGIFTKCISSMEHMMAKYGKNPKYIQNAATVITPEGREEFLQLGSYLLKKGIIDAQVFEIIRGKPKDPSVQNLPPEELKKLRQNVARLFNAQAENLFKDFPKLKRAIAKRYFLGFIKFMNDIQDANLIEPTDWKMDCVAGKTTLVIDHNGDFRSCEMRPPIGNVKDYDFNMTKVMESKAMKKEVEEIGNGYKANCWCTHACWVVCSQKFSPKALLYRIPASYYKWKKEGVLNKELPKVNIEEIENYDKNTPKTIEART